MNRRSFLRSTLAGGLLAPMGVGAIIPTRRAVLLGSGISPWGTWNFANGLPSIFKHEGTWRVLGGVLVNEPTLGPELVTNGGFDSGTGWTPEAGWAIGSGVATATATSNRVYRQLSAIATLSWFRAQIDIVSVDAGTIRFRPKNITPTYGVELSSTGTAIPNTIITTDAASVYFHLTGYSFTGVVDNLSFKAITLSTLPNLVDLRTPNASITAAVAALTAGTQAGILANYIDENNFLYVVFDGAGSVKAVERIAGTYSADRLGASSAFSANDQLQVISSNGTVTVKKNGTTLGSAFALNAALTSGTKFGLFSTYSGNQITSCTFAKV